MHHSARTQQSFLEDMRCMCAIIYHKLAVCFATVDDTALTYPWGNIIVAQDKASNLGFGAHGAQCGVKV